MTAEFVVMLLNTVGGEPDPYSKINPHWKRFKATLEALAQNHGWSSGEKATVRRLVKGTLPPGAEVEICVYLTLDKSPDQETVDRWTATIRQWWQEKEDKLGIPRHGVQARITTSSVVDVHTK